MKFFVVHTYTGREQRVKKLLENAIAYHQLESLFGKIVVPAERVRRFRKSKPVIEERRLYPGYIIVEMEPKKEAMRLVSSIPGVTHFLGNQTSPSSLSEKEVKEMTEQIEKGEHRVKAEAPFEKGENVKVIAGPFNGFTGTVDEIFTDRNRVKVTVTIFGRPTPIELDFSQVQTI